MKGGCGQPTEPDLKPLWIARDGWHEYPPFGGCLCQSGSEESEAVDGGVLSSLWELRGLWTCYVNPQGHESSEAVMKCLIVVFVLVIEMLLMSGFAHGEDGRRRGSNCPTIFIEDPTDAEPWVWRKVDENTASLINPYGTKYMQSSLQDLANGDVGMRCQATPGIDPLATSGTDPLRGLMTG